jgi:hypothetical protein
MAANPKWARWIAATYIKSIRADLAAATPPLPVVFDLGPKRPPKWENADRKAEVTISGPMLRRVSPTRYLVFVNAFVVLTSNLTKDNYDHAEACGVVQNALMKCFTVMDYGDTNICEIGILRPRKGGAEETTPIEHLRPSEEDTQLHSTISARYEGRFSTT